MKNNELDTIIDNLRKKGLSYSEIFQLMKKEDIDSIPIKILENRKLGALQAITVFLKEEKKLGFSKIARLLNRDDRTIWATYKNAKQKLKQ